MLHDVEFRARIGSNLVWVEAEVDIRHEDYTTIILAVTLMDSDEKMLAPLDIEDLFVVNTRTGAVVPALQEIKFLAEEKAYETI
jgi:hypothetical protein